MDVYALNLADKNYFIVAKYSSISSLINLFSPILITGGAILFLVMLIIAGFNVLTAEGNAEKLGKAQKTFMFAIAGLLIVISSYLIVKLLGVVLNIQDQLKPFGF